MQISTTKGGKKKSIDVASHSIKQDLIFHQVVPLMDHRHLGKAPFH